MVKIIRKRQSSPFDLAWAAGLFIGEGNCGIITRREKLCYMQVQIQMYDERAIRKFASIVGLPVYAYWNKALNHWVYRVATASQRAEAVMRLLWPFLEGTDKGDQVQQVAMKLGIFDWINGIRCDERKRGEVGLCVS